MTMYIGDVHMRTHGTSCALRGVESLSVYRGWRWRLPGVVCVSDGGGVQVGEGVIKHCNSKNCTD
jgi:hypothetical protein